MTRTWTRLATSGQELCEQIIGGVGGETDADATDGGGAIGMNAGHVEGWRAPTRWGRSISVA